MKKGTLIYWSVSDFNTTTEEISSAGFEDFVPRNDYRTAMLKAIREYVKGEEKMYRRFNDTSASVSFAILIENPTSTDYTVRKEAIITVDKTTGAASHRSPEGWDVTPIKKAYDLAKDTLNSDQFRRVVLDYVEERGGVSMRPGGGIYFVDNDLEAKCLPKLRDLFGKFPGKTIFYEVPIYDDSATLIALEDATSAKIFGDIDEIVKEVEDKFAKGVPVTRRQIESRCEDAQVVVAKIRLHEKNLRSKASEVKHKLKAVEAVLNEMLAKSADIVDPSEFSGLLRGL